MAVVSDKFKYIFLAEPHCASRAIRDALIEQHGANGVGHHHMTRVHLLRKEMINLRRQRYKFFSVVRHPFDVLLTGYYFTKMVIPFSDYLRWKLEHGLRFVHDSKVLPSDTYIHFERLDVELDNLMDGLNAPRIVLSHVGKTENKPTDFMAAYSQEDIDFVIRQADVEKHYVL